MLCRTLFIEKNRVLERLRVGIAIEKSGISSSGGEDRAGGRVAGAISMDGVRASHGWGPLHKTLAGAALPSERAVKTKARDPGTRNALRPDG
jgi:hypothetical protein